MAIKFNRSQTFATNGTVTAAGLHNLIDGTDIYQALITDQTNLTSVGSADELLIADADLTANDAPRAVTVNELFEDALTISTYTNANLTNISYGTSTGTRLVSTNASITTGTIPSLTSSTASITIGTIPTLTAGTTTSTAASITNGTIQTLTSSTATITSGTFSGLLNSSTGTFSGAINSTLGTVGTLNSTTGTIGNLTTTLAGDFTISDGTGTLGTTGVTAGTYGTSTIIPRIAVDVKGRVTSVGTSAVVSGKILQVVQTVKTDTFSADADTFTDVTGLSVSITPSSASNKILVLAVVNGSSDDYAAIRLVRDSTAISVGDAAGSRISSSGAQFYDTPNPQMVVGSTIIFLDSPATTSSLTYKIQCRHSGGAFTFYVNRSSTDTDSEDFQRTVSSILVMEVAA